MSSADDVLAAMLDRAADRLASYGYLLTGSQAAGEELVQAAVVKVFARRRWPDAVPAAEAYVRATMRTMHVDTVRREATWRRLVTRQRPEVARGDFASDVVERDALTSALARLAPAKRTAVVLRYYDDLSYAQIADSMQVSIGTVKRYLSDAREQLGAIVGVGNARVPVQEVKER